jgi:O-antigen ligase
MSSVDFPSRGLRIRNVEGEQFLDRFNIPIATIAGLTLIFAVSFLNLANLSADKDSVGIDAQVLVKLIGIAGAGLYGAYGFCTDRRVRDVLQSFPLFWMIIIIAMYFVAALFSITPLISLASAIAMVAVLLMTVTSLVQIGVLPVLNSIFAGVACFNVISWVVYFVWPDIGILAEPLPEGKFQERMSGLAHPNTLGQVTGLTIVLGTVLFATYRKRSRLRVGLILVAVAALVNSLSRTSLASTVLALLFAYRHVFLKRKYLELYVAACFFGLIGVLLISTQVNIGKKIEDKLTLVSKSGDAEELTSATGRAQIWAYTIRLIKLRPMAGYGAATSKYFLSDYSFYTHNMLLNVAFSTGIIGGTVMLIIILGRLRSMLLTPHPLIDAILMFIIINGFFENVILSILCGMPTMLWFIALTLPSLKDKSWLSASAQKVSQRPLPASEGRLRFSQ